MLSATGAGGGDDDKFMPNGDPDEELLERNGLVWYHCSSTM